METVNEFIKTLKESEELRDEVRAVILTDELLRLPAGFRAIVDKINDFIAQQENTNARLEAAIADLKTAITRLEVFNEETIVHRRNREQRYNRDMERIRNAASYTTAFRELDLMAEDMGMTRVRTLKRKEILDLSKKLAQGARLEGNLRSFAKADIIFIADRQGEECYVPVEVSYTADQRDTDRAIRNADYLTRLTGANAFPVIACVNVDKKIQNLIDSGKVHLYEIEEIFLQEE